MFRKAETTPLYYTWVMIPQPLQVLHENQCHFLQRLIIRTRVDLKQQQWHLPIVSVDCHIWEYLHRWKQCLEVFELTDLLISKHILCIEFSLNPFTNEVLFWSMILCLWTNHANKGIVVIRCYVSVLPTRVAIFSAGTYWLAIQCLRWKNQTLRYAFCLLRKLLMMAVTRLGAELDAPSYREKWQGALEELRQQEMLGKEKVPQGERERERGF